MGALRKEVKMRIKLYPEYLIFSLNYSKVILTGIKKGYVCNLAHTNLLILARYCKQLELTIRLGFDYLQTNQKQGKSLCSLLLLELYASSFF